MAEVVPLQESKEPSLSEVGRTGRSDFATLFLEDYNPDLRGFSAIDIFDKMRRNDAKVRASLRIVKTPLVSGQWYMDHDEHVEEQHKAQALVWWALNSMKKDLDQMLYEALSFLDFGFYDFEPVYEFGEFQGRRVVKWKKWGPRHPRTIIEWMFDDAEGGDFAGLRQMTDDGEKEIPVEKLLHFALDPEGGNPDGISILRSAYKHWYYKENMYKVDAIQKERHGIGVPDVELPENFTPDTKKYAEELARNLRTNEKSYIVRLPGMQVGFVQFQGTHVDVLSSIEHHDTQIAANVLAQFLNLGSTGSGSRAISESQQDIFIRSVRHVAGILTGIINAEVRRLLRFNGFRSLETYPKLKVRRIGEAADIRAFAVGIRNLVEPGVLTATPELEQFVRAVLDVPHGGPEVEGRGPEDRLPKAKKPEGPKPSGEREESRRGRPRE